ncbi:MAG: hypothetical protein KA765_05635 [Thermoflexales bacterium]|nr:hypothetical protein [Thermoflexales bacterium]
MTPPSAVNPSGIALPLKRFMLIEHCPADWRALDLYVFRDEAVTFYVGQSYLAFDRVWDHLRNGFKGRSVIGRFILSNWPASLRFTIELLSSQSEQFAIVENDLDRAERDLIQHLSPCFNAALNSQPTPCPARYAPLNAPLRCGRSLNKLIHEAERAVKADEQSRWLEA